MGEADEQPDRTETRAWLPRRVLVVLSALVVVAVVGGVFVSVLTTGSDSHADAPTTTRQTRRTTTSSATASAPLAEVSVTPTAGLRSRQVVTVTASGFDPGTTVTFLECLPLKANPNPPATPRDRSADESAPTTRPTGEVGTCQWQEPTVTESPTTGIGSTGAVTATVGDDGRASASLTVADNVRDGSGLGWLGENLQYLRLGPVPCNQAPVESASDEAGPE